MFVVNNSDKTEDSQQLSTFITALWLHQLLRKEFLFSSFALYLLHMHVDRLQYYISIMMIWSHIQRNLRTFRAVKFTVKTSSRKKATIFLTFQCTYLFYILHTCIYVYLYTCMYIYIYISFYLPAYVVVWQSFDCSEVLCLCACT